MVATVSIGREVDPVLDSVTGAPIGISVGSAGVSTFVTAVAGSTGVLPAATTTAFGAGTGVVRADGNLNVQVSSVGVSPGATGADNVVAVYTIPASSFDVAGREVTVSAFGSYAANGDTKTVKIIFNPSTAIVGSTVGTGGTLVASTGAVTTSGGGWAVSGVVTKYGAAASNTQITTSVIPTTTAPTLATATESGTILVAVTANCATTASDVVFNVLTVSGSN